MKDESGYGTVAALALLLACVLLGVAASVGATALVVKHQLQQAADMSALAGAQGLAVSLTEVSSVSACEEAASLAADNGAQLLDCQVGTWDVRVRVGRQVQLPLVGGLELEAKARAGFDDLGL
ncbi:MAG: flp pilus-assembly TadE/G-like family protein [Actinomycetaceae bacterium]|nr:flp pilus-assembly TadE/G-like family protein [Actinomycetaceae bacterium]